MRHEHQAFVNHTGVDFEVIPKGLSVKINDLSWRVDWLRYSSVGDHLIYGWIATPENHQSSKEAFVWLPGYSYGTPTPDSSNLVKHATTICINLHGNLPDHPYINPAGKDDYIGNGLESPETYVYKNMALHCLLAVDVATKLDGINPNKIVIAGMSQGGGLALITAAHHPNVKLCFADMPFLCDIRNAVFETKRAAYQSLRDAVGDSEERLATVELFDPLFHAPLLTLPTHITAGGRDPASRVETVRPVYPQIGSQIKAFRFFPEAGHVFVKEMPGIYRKWMNHVFFDD